MLKKFKPADFQFDFLYIYITDKSRLILPHSSHRGSYGTHITVIEKEATMFYFLNFYLGEKQFSQKI